MTIRKKIIIGFVSLAVLLFFSGVISYFELRRLSRETSEIFTANTHNLDLSRQMLDVMQQQAFATAVAIDGNNKGYDSLYKASSAALEGIMLQATVTVRDREEMQQIYAAHNIYEKVLADYVAMGAPAHEEWFDTTFRNAYGDLSGAIKDYMVVSQDALREKSSNLGKTAYRAITPGILALSVGIVILLMFLFLIDVYFSRPINAINRSLKGYVAQRIPFNVKDECSGEVAELRDGIDDLIALYKSRKTE